MKSVYIIGSKGIPANYGGFETFVEKLTENQKNKNIKYFVACTRENSKKSNISEDFFEYNGATCFNIDVPNIGPAKAIAGEWGRKCIGHWVNGVGEAHKNKTRKQHTTPDGVEDIREKETEAESKYGRKEIKGLSSRIIWRTSHTFIYVEAFLAG